MVRLGRRCLSGHKVPGKVTQHARTRARAHALPRISQDKYEPYVVVQNIPELPLYDEAFQDYGMNKITHIMELYAAGYTFIVLGSAWTCHVPHSETKLARNFLKNMDARVENRLQR